MKTAGGERWQDTCKWTACSRVLGKVVAAGRPVRMSRPRWVGIGHAGQTSSRRCFRGGESSAFSAVAVSD
jgi:hypothetical protein